MEHTCPKCKVGLTEGQLDHAGPLRVYQKGEGAGLFGPDTKQMDDICPFVCPECGLVEFYVPNPGKFQ